MMRGRIEEFVQQVHDAFGESTYPGDNNIVYQNALKYHHDESIKTLESFKGQIWQDITLETLIANRDHLPSFTREAYRYYLPAFMIATILHYDEVDVLSNNTYYSLASPDGSDGEDKEFANRVEGITSEQILVIREFLRLYAQLSPYSLTHDPNHHLKRATEFWDDISNK